MMQKTILFDLDGTLIDSTEAILYGFNHTFEEFAHNKPSDDEISRLIGHPLEYMYENLGVCVSDVDKFVQSYKLIYRKISRQMTTMLPNALKAIEEASKFARLGVVTTKTGKYSKELLEHMDVLKQFEVVIGREDVINPKPHREPILKALEAMKITSHDNVYMIGDTCLDMDSAKSAGVYGIGVGCGYVTKEEIAGCSKTLVEDSLEAVRFIYKTDGIV